jgi:hypothetical protein
VSVRSKRPDSPVEEASLQRRVATIGVMDQDVDAAIEIATDRTREAQEELADKLVETPEVEPEARLVEHRAEDLHELAMDAAIDDPADASG